MPWGRGFREVLLGVESALTDAMWDIQERVGKLAPEVGRDQRPERRSM
jgi:hypothetical protein